MAEKKEKIIIAMQVNEVWYGGRVADGIYMPFDRKTDFVFDSSDNRYNQVNPVFLSNCGRYIWLENGGRVEFCNGKITIDAAKSEYGECGGTLKEAFIGVSKRFFPANGETPDKRVFEAPMYSSWIALDHKITQTNLLSYARTLVEKGFKPGVLIIDDGWQEDYGDWEFDLRSFPDPESMITELRALGFTPVFWLVPFVLPNSKTFRERSASGGLVRGADGKPIIGEWWNGYSAMLDLKNPSDAAWYEAQCEKLESKYGEIGLKLDGGDVQYYPADGEIQSKLWIDIPDNAIKEARACYQLAGKGIVQRLADVGHLWKCDIKEDALSPDGTCNRTGLEILVPDMLAQGITGYAFGCPDMVGGGNICTFDDASELDGELIVRWCQASSLMPIVQFSLDVWNIERGGVAKHCLQAMKMRDEFVPYIEVLAENAAETGEPIVRYMEYEFPHQGLERVTNQFMLGDRYLIAPVIEKGARTREVALPLGTWKDLVSGTIYEGGRSLTVSAEIDILPVFERIA